MSSVEATKLRDDLEELKHDMIEDSFTGREKDYSPSQVVLILSIVSGMLESMSKYPNDTFDWGSMAHISSKVDIRISTEMEKIKDYVYATNTRMYNLLMRQEEDEKIIENHKGLFTGAELKQILLPLLKFV